MNLAGVEAFLGKSAFVRMGAHPGERGFGRFAHHVAELAGQSQTDPLAAVDASRLDEENFSAMRGHRETHRGAGHG